jgi:3-hydroxyisobutyrate dehydrogenase-like beta-hydroxyacid dehydrogenase
MARIAVLHPGQMGASVAAAAAAGGADVAWASAGRSAATAARAAADGLRDAGTVPELVAGADVVVSVCPPASALEVATTVAALRFAGTYVDANAVSPVTARRVGAVVGAAGARFVDGGIVGPPARSPGTTRLFLSGAGAGDVAALFAGSPLEALVVEGDAGAASALKVAYAAWTKGSGALLLAVRALAEAEGVGADLEAEWARSQPALVERVARTARGNGPKAWRFVGEMEEIADTFAAAGLPDGFHRAAADVYRRLERWKDAPAPELADVLPDLLGSGRDDLGADGVQAQERG